MDMVWIILGIVFLMDEDLFGVGIFFLLLGVM